MSRDQKIKDHAKASKNEKNLTSPELKYASILIL